jgi:hypothetical protein
MAAPRAAHILASFLNRHPIYWDIINPRNWHPASKATRIMFVAGNANPEPALVALGNANPEPNVAAALAWAAESHQLAGQIAEQTILGSKFGQKAIDMLKAFADDMCGTPVPGRLHWPKDRAYPSHLHIPQIGPGGDPCRGLTLDATGLGLIDIGSRLDGPIGSALVDAGEQLIIFANKTF